MSKNQIHKTDHALNEAISELPDRDMFYALLQHLPDAVYIKDVNGTYRMVNQSMAELLGRSDVSEVIDRTDDDLLSPEKAHNNRVDERHVLESGIPIQEKTEFIKNIRGGAWFSFTKTPLRDAEGRITGVIGVGRDISENVINEKKEHATSYDLKAVVEIADRLIASSDLDTLLRKAIELARSHLRVERCSILLNQGDHLRGTFGTDLNGNTTDERDFIIPMDAAWENRFRMWHKKSSQWIVERDIQRSSPDARGPDTTNTRDFWVATTPIKGSNNRMIGVFCNDSVITKATPDERLQDVIAVFCSLLGNIIERQRGMDDLRQRDQVLEGVARSASQLLIEENLDSAIRESLRVLGESMQVDRVYIFKNHMDPLTGEWLMSQRYEWSRVPSLTEMTNVELQDLPYQPHFEKMYEMLASGQVYNGTRVEMRGYMRQFLESQKIASLLLVPIHISNQFWGFIGFDDCQKTREWSANEKTILLAMAGNLGGAINQELTERELKSRDRILSGVAKANHELLTNPELDVAIANSLRILASAVNIERIYLCENQTEQATGLPVMCPRFLYDKVSSKLDRFLGSNLSLSFHEHLPGWYTIMSSGKPIHGRLLDFFQKNSDSVHSVLVAPLMIEKKFWGVIGFDTSDTEHNWTESDVSTLATMAGSIGGAIARKRAEESLRSSEEHFRSLIENASDLIIVVNELGHINYGSPSVERELGYRTIQLSSVNFFDLIHTEDLAAIRIAFEKATRLNEPSALLEIRMRHYLGHWRNMECAIKCVPDEQGNARLIVNSRDITERVKTEDALRQSEELLRHSQKMEAVGRLAGGIAHDFNNLLTAILGYGDLLLERITDDHDMRNEVAEIHRAAKRAHSLTSQLLAFSRRQVMAPVCLDLNAVVFEIERLLKRLISEDIILLTRTSEVPCPVKIDRGQIEQVIVNLSLNAKDAMHNGGEICITTENCHVRKPIVQGMVNVPPGHYVKLTISDTGHGISDDIKPHIFEPFFTTKEVGKGTGLGLSMVYGTIDQSGGHIMFDSEVNKGTRFSIYLPKIDMPMEAPPEEVSLSTRGGDERILLIEDDPIVRELSRRILSDKGYLIVTRENGAQGLEYFKEHADDIDLVLTDIIMPQLSGLSFARAARKIRPDLRVLFMSGYSEDQQPELHESGEGRNYIQKPFTVAVLCSRIRELLDQPAATSK